MRLSGETGQVFNPVEDVEALAASVEKLAATVEVNRVPPTSRAPSSPKSNS